MRGLGGQADAAAWGEISADDGFFGVGGSNDVLQDAIDDFLVKGLMIAKRGEVKFERLGLDAHLIGDVADLNARGIGLSRHRTERRKFGKIEMHPVVVLWAAVGERFQFCLGR